MSLFNLLTRNKQPKFKAPSVVAKNHVISFDSNFCLYGVTTNIMECGNMYDNIDLRTLSDANIFQYVSNVLNRCEVAQSKIAPYANSVVNYIKKCR